MRGLAVVFECTMALLVVEEWEFLRLMRLVSS